MKRKTMLRFYCCLVFISFFSASTQAQPFFDAYKNQEGVQYLSINPMMFRLLGQMNLQTDDPESAAYLSMIQSIRSFKVLVTTKTMITNSLEEVIAKWVHQESLQLLLQLEEKEQLLRFFAETGEAEQKVKRLLMFSKGKQLEEAISIEGKKLQSVVLLLEGDIDLEVVGKLTDTMDIPGGEQLKKIKK
ncbi:MAG: DUF4252 domain-containing protein [Flavobacteriaceae bacterium]